CARKGSYYHGSQTGAFDFW
nr:immunoglobulin heavy chain junction region [Macaca mulatta]